MAPTARALARAPLVLGLPASRREQPARPRSIARGAATRWRREKGRRWRCRRDAPARCRHGRAVAPPLAQSLPVGVGGRRGRQSVGARPCGGRAGAPARASSSAAVPRGEVPHASGTGERLEVRGGAHRFEAVRAGLGVVEKTAWYDMMMPPSEVTAPDRRFTRLREEPLQIESRDEDACDKGCGGARAQGARSASRGERARCCAYAHTMVVCGARRRNSTHVKSGCAQCVRDATQSVGACVRWEGSRRARRGGGARCT